MGVIISTFVFSVLAETADFQTRWQMHQACNAEAEVRILPQDEMEVCMQNYLMLKLHFTGVDLTDFLNMPTAQRAALNREGYRLYREWIAQQSGS